MYSFGTQLNRAFFDHWQSLRQGAALPLLKDFLSDPQPLLQPHVVIQDILPQKRIHVRLHGTRLVELAGDDLTGQDLLDYSDTPEMAEDLWFFLRGIVDHPVGLRFLKHTVTAAGRNVTFEELALPMAPFPEGPPCVIGSVVLQEEVSTNDTVSHLLTYSGATWIDIGCGTPAFGPFRTGRAGLLHAAGA